MNRALLDQIVNATLYEGYILYPYRPSSKKNRRERFTFGRVYPEAYSAAQNGAEPCSIQTECLLNTAGPAATLDVSVRFLHPMSREIGVFAEPVFGWDGVEPAVQVVPELRVGNELYQTWDEAVEREVNMSTLALRAKDACLAPFQFPGSRQVEPLRDGNQIVGLAIRRQHPLQGTVAVSVQPLGGTLFKVSVRVRNNSSLPPSELENPQALMLRLFASTHTILCVTNAGFVSQTDPPPELKTASAACQNIGGWPVLVGDESKNERDTMLSAPIILYDYPKIAPESAGPLFDGTEIDEILTLRILTMADDEKREMRQVDEHARRLLERTEALSADSLLKMHGQMRPTPDSEPRSKASIEFDDFFGAATGLKGVSVGGVYLQPGDRVRLRPKARADAMDMMMSGQIAIIEAVEQDLEQRIHLAVVLENDPGKDLGMMRQPGHRFFYGVDEVEPVKEGVS